jgi:hypothetical protein
MPHAMNIEDIIVPRMANKVIAPKLVQNKFRLRWYPEQNMMGGRNPKKNIWLLNAIMPRACFPSSLYWISENSIMSRTKELMSMPIVIVMVGSGMK